MTNKAGLIAALIVPLLSAAVGAQAQTSLDMRAAARAKALFGISESFCAVSLNTQFGYRQANQPAFRALRLHLATLNYSKLRAKAKKAENQCATKDCKATLPPISDLLKEWENLRKELGNDDESYAMMGEASAGISFYYRNAPHLTEALQKPLQSLSLKRASLAADACSRTQRCPASVKAAFEALAKGLLDETSTAEKAEASLKIIRDQMQPGQ